MDFDFSPIVDNWRFFASGLGITVALSAVTAVSSILLGLVIALLRLYGPRWLRVLLVFYIDSMRAIPVLVVLVWIYFAFPLLAGVTFAPFWAALVALTLHIAAYSAEVIRAGIESVRPGQMRAGLALGMSRAQALRKIILPQATIRMLPAFGSVLTVAIKDTAIATDRGARADAQGRDHRRAELPADRGVHRGDRGVLRDPVPGDARRGPAVPTLRTPGALMNLDWGIIWDSRQVLLQGAAMTVMLTVVTMALAVPGGMVLALMRLSSNRVANGIAVAIVEFFRNLPLILVIYWAFYVMPMALDVQFSAVTTALVALVLNVSAYNSETFRAGINSIRKGQMEAALAMGMSRRQAMFKVLVPQAARRILPGVMSECSASCCRRPPCGCCRRSPRPGSRCSRTPRWCR
jgi:polar amino acid transport system permease protein